MTSAWPLIRVISGGQTGADLAGLIAARRLGYQTVGTMPAHFQNECGQHPEYAEWYHVVASGNYASRTWQNVVGSDGTLIVGRLDTPGCSLTAKICRQQKRPRMPIMFTDVPDDAAIPVIACQVRSWIVAKQIRVLNVAGNRESTMPGIGAWTERLLMVALARSV